MKRILLSMAALSALAAAAPAAAQYSRSYDYRSNPSQEIQRLQWQIDADARRGLVSAGDAARLRGRVAEIRRLADRYGYGGLSGWERSDLDGRIARIRDDLRYAEAGRGYGSGGYGSTYGEQGYDRGYGGNGGVYGNDADDDAYGGTSYGDGYYGNDGSSYDGSTYDGSTYDGSGYDGSNYDGSSGYDSSGGSYDDSGYDAGSDQGYDGSWTGSAAGASGTSGPELRVGDHAPADLDPVPAQFRSLYPDGDLVYYRYGDGAVYQIDRATNTIRWVGEIPY